MPSLPCRLQSLTSSKSPLAPLSITCRRKLTPLSLSSELITNRFLPSAKDYIWQMRTVYEKAQDDEQSGQSLAFLYQ